MHALRTVEADLLPIAVGQREAGERAQHIGFRAAKAIGNLGNALLDLWIVGEVDPGLSGAVSPQLP